MKMYSGDLIVNEFGQEKWGAIIADYPTMSEYGLSYQAE